MTRLTVRYAPKQISDFIGLEEPKRIIGRWLSDPYPIAFLFQGEPGTGKTKMGEAIALTLNREISPYNFIHIASSECNVDAVRSLQDRLMYAPWGSYWVILIDEADRMTASAQIAFLSMLDNIPQNTVVVFTCNETTGLEPRFLSRCCQIKFSNYGLNGTGSAFLKSVWESECKGMAAVPNFTRILKDSRNNLRDSLMVLERELLAVSQ